MAKFTVKPTGPFRKDLKLAKRRGLPLNDLYTVVGMLENDEPLPTKYHNHLLSDFMGRLVERLFWKVRFVAVS